MSERCGTLRRHGQRAAARRHAADGGRRPAPRTQLASPPALPRSPRQRSPETRRTYAAVYRSFGTFLGLDATAEDLTPETVRAYRDHRASRAASHRPEWGGARAVVADARPARAQRQATWRYCTCSARQGYAARRPPTC
jgi:hypothetical protein